MREREREMDGRDVAVGFRFSPTEEELLSYYLPHKLNGTKPEIDWLIPLVNIYDYNPWDLPQFCGEAWRADKEEWFLFTAMQEREARGGRPNRLTEKGYWKSTGSPCDVYTYQNLRIGRKRSMVFYEGRAPNGTKTTWKMNEYKVYDTTHHHQSAQLKDELSLCRIYKGSKRARSYDRRPAVVQYHHHHLSADVAVATTDNQQNISAVESELINWDLETETESLLDSELQVLIDWFDL